MSRMYESTDELFEGLEGVEVDPHMQRLIRQAAELEDLLNNNDNHDERTEIARSDLEREAIETMDSECVHLHQSVLVTGTVLRAYYDEFEEKFITAPVEMSHELVTSAGFATLSMKPEGAEDERMVVGHLFLLEQLPAQRDTPALVDYVTRLFGFAPVGQVDIEFESPDQDNIDVLQRHVPELLEEIDELVGNAQDECHALMNLGKMTISPELDIPSDMLSRLLSYAHARLNFDTGVPYEVVVQGVFYDEDGSKEPKFKYFQEKPGLLLAYPISLSFLPYPRIVDKELQLTDEAYWCVELRAMGLRPEDPDQRFSIPARNIRSMHSIRQVASGL